MMAPATEPGGKAGRFVKRILMVAAGGILLTLVATAGAWAFGTKDVLAMQRDGIADSLIMQKISYSHTRFHLGSDDIRSLKSAGVSDEVISAMLRTESRDDYGPYAGSYWGPYCPYVGPYYVPYGYYYHPYYYPRVRVGLDFRFRGGSRRWHRF